MTHWTKPMPETTPTDPLARIDQANHPAEWVRCIHCGQWVSRRTGSSTWPRSATCSNPECNLTEDRFERERVMSPRDIATFHASAESYLSSPDRVAEQKAHLRGGNGLSRLSDKDRERISLKRAQDELDALEAQERGL